MSWVKDKYTKLSPSERKQLVILIVFSFLAAYLFYAAKTWEQMFDTEKLANRKADRIEKRIGEIKPPELEEGVSDQVLADLQKQLAAQEKSLQEYAATLLPLGDATAREALKLELTQLAYANQLRLSKMQASDLQSVANVTELKGEKLRSYLNNRPAFKLTLSGQFLNLVRFIDSLNQLSYQAYVNDLKVELVNDQNSLVKIDMELRI